MSCHVFREVIFSSRFYKFTSFQLENMLGKILIATFLILIAVIGYEYYFNHYIISNQSSNAKYVDTTTMTHVTHYFNYSSAIGVYANSSGTYIYPINLPGSGNISLTIKSDTPFNVKVYDNSTLIIAYSGTDISKHFIGGGKLELEFYNFYGKINISVNEIY